jgi:hypothetical protein
MWYDKFEDTNTVIWYKHGNQRHQRMTDNDQKKKDKRTNIDTQNSRQKTKDCETHFSLLI